MIPILLVTTLLYAAMTLYRKSYLLTEFNIQTWMLINSGFMFGMICILALIRPKEFFDKNTIPTLKKNMLSITLYKSLTLITTFVWLYMLKKYDMSILMPLNMIFVTLFSTILGVIVLKEKLTIRQGIGIALAMCSICLIHC